MPLLLIIYSFLAGLLICISVPYLTAGLRGETLPTPFAKPRGVGLSTPLANVIGGWLSLFLGLAIMPHFVFLSPVMPLFNMLWVSFALGFLVAGLFLALHFSRARHAAAHRPGLPNQ